MPAKSKSQQRLFGAALNAKRGGKTFPEAEKLAEKLSAKQLKDFATTKSSGSVKPKSYLKE